MQTNPVVARISESLNEKKPLHCEEKPTAYISVRKTCQANWVLGQVVMIKVISVLWILVDTPEMRITRKYLYIEKMSTLEVSFFNLVM